MESFLLALSVVLPMLLMMTAGVLVRRAGIVDAVTAKKMDGLNFRLFLPCLLFVNICQSDLAHDFSIGVVLYVLAAFLVLMTALLLVVPRLLKRPEQISVVCQAIFRGNFVIFGLTVTEYIYGAESTGTASLLSAIVVPLMNVSAVVLLEYFRPGGSGHVEPKKLLLGVAKNPLIIGCALGVVVSLLGLELPEMVFSPIRSMSKVATPLAFVLLGATLSLDGFRRNRRILTGTLLVRMVLVPAVMITAAILLGFRGVELASIMVLFGAPTAVSSFSMAQQMGADGELAAQLVALTSVCALPTIFSLTLVLRLLGYL